MRLAVAFALVMLALSADAAPRKKAWRCIDRYGTVIDGVGSKKVCKQMGGTWKKVPVSH